MFNFIFVFTFTFIYIIILLLSYNYYYYYYYYYYYCTFYVISLFFLYISSFCKSIKVTQLYDKKIKIKSFINNYLVSCRKKKYIYNNVDDKSNIGTFNLYHNIRDNNNNNNNNDNNNNLKKRDDVLFPLCNKNIINDVQKIYDEVNNIKDKEQKINYLMEQCSSLCKENYFPPILNLNKAYRNKRIDEFNKGNKNFYINEVGKNIWYKYVNRCDEILFMAIDIQIDEDEQRNNSIKDVHDVHDDNIKTCTLIKDDKHFEKYKDIHNDNILKNILPLDKKIDSIKNMLNHKYMKKKKCIITIDAYSNNLILYCFLYLILKHINKMYLYSFMNIQIKEITAKLKELFDLHFNVHHIIDYIHEYIYNFLMSYHIKRKKNKSKNMKEKDIKNVFANNIIISDEENKHISKESSDMYKKKK
ncbi:hypothetical protein PFFCH_01905, partial [Plasmodium falciparum FCH/4]